MDPIFTRKYLLCDFAFVYLNGKLSSVVDTTNHHYWLSIIECAILSVGPPWLSPLCVSLSSPQRYQSMVDKKAIRLGLFPGSLHTLIEQHNITHLCIGCAVRIKVVAHTMESQIESRNCVQIFPYERRGAPLAARNKGRGFSFHFTGCCRSINPKKLAGPRAVDSNQANKRWVAGVIGKFVVRHTVSALILPACSSFTTFL